MTTRNKPKKERNKRRAAPDAPMTWSEVLKELHRGADDAEALYESLKTVFELSEANESLRLR